jgi:transcriptional regulator with XRE-family HTH domain
MSLLTLGQFLQTKRLGLGFNLAEAGRRTGLVPQSISNYENGKAIPRPKALVKLAKGYGLSLSELEEFVPMDGVVNTIKERKTPITNLIKSINQLSNKIEECMDGESYFEKNIKRKALDNLDKIEELLQDIVIIDEAF